MKQLIYVDIAAPRGFRITSLAKFRLPRELPLSGILGLMLNLGWQKPGEFKFKRFGKRLGAGRLTTRHKAGTTPSQSLAENLRSAE